MIDVDTIQAVLTEHMPPRHREDYPFRVTHDADALTISTTVECRFSTRSPVELIKKYALSQFGHCMHSFTREQDKAAQQQLQAMLLSECGTVTKKEVFNVVEHGGLKGVASESDLVIASINAVLTSEYKNHLEWDIGPRIIDWVAFYPEQIVFTYNVDIACKVPLCALDKGITDMQRRLVLRDALLAALPEVPDHNIYGHYDNLSWDRAANRFFITVETAANADQDSRPAMRRLISDIFGVAPWEIDRKFIPAEPTGFEKAFYAETDAQGRLAIEWQALQYSRAQDGRALGEEQDCIPFGKGFLPTSFYGRARENAERKVKTKYRLTERYSIELDLDDHGQIEAVTAALQTYQNRAELRKFAADIAQASGIANVHLFIKPDGAFVFYTDAKQGTVTMSEALTLRKALALYGKCRVMGVAGKDEMTYQFMPSSACSVDHNKLRHD